MNPIPEAAIAVIAAALEDHRLLTPPDESTPRVQAEYAAMYLASSGYALVPAPATAAPREAA
ncbi:hypothetical protein [Streptomyces sp. SCSIO ZS0520]|uniref:hypothetical protein n=1 Tax=Streptomyces sp. SCSIO ZS0520 TaxID=2892996 RepID=UPI0021DA148A|nr:hypothetical protein [Streptomyces sp. SCSIO ZS0520]